MEATEISQNAINKAYCDWIFDKTKELKELFSHDSENTIKLNKKIALTDIETVKNSLSELKLYIESL